VDTLGHQKKVNYALRADMTRDEFIKEVTAGLAPPPSYFPENVKMNKDGYESIDIVLGKGLRALPAEAFEITANETGALVLDTRDPQVFAKGFIPGSINIGIDGSFAPWVGALIPGTQQPLLIVCETGREEEVITRLARVGFDNAIGYLAGGFKHWLEAGKDIDTVDTVTAADFSERLKEEALYVIDVRKPSEFEAEHAVNAVNVPLDYINSHLAEIPRTGRVYLHCAGGYRSMIAASILKARGWNNLVDVEGGFKAIAAAGVPCTEFSCTKTI
jgi:hydroxyacylglutathione hydrolase